MTFLRQLSRLRKQPQVRQTDPGIRRKRWLFASLAASIGALSFPLGVVSHEPVTTNVRFNKEIIRILNAKCIACHSTEGIKSDISLSSYDEARPWAKAIKEEVLEKRMPPYQAVKGFGSFHTDYALSQRETDLLVSWVEGGAPKGDEKDLPAPEAPGNGGWKLGKPDLELTGGEPVKVVPEESATRCVMIPTRLETDRWISGFEFRPGNPTVVNSATFRIVAGNGSMNSCAEVSPAARVGELLGTWVPGELPVKYPSDAARLLLAGSKILLEIEYRGAKEAVSDRSSLGVYFAETERAKQVQTVALPAPAIRVAAAAKAVKVAAHIVVQQDAEVIGVRPRLFPYASSVEARAVRPDGTSQVLIWSRNRRSEWEPSFMSKRPVKLTKGTRVEAVAYLDNSDSNPRLQGEPIPIEFKGTLCDLFIASPTRGRDAGKLTVN